MSNNATETQRIIYSMLGVSKTINQKEILKGISLSYFYGAKIGVLGLNGSGKSTLLRILAGLDKEFEGKIEMAPGFRVGFLEQEPLKNEKRTVDEVIREGAAEVTKLMDEYDRLNEKLCDATISDDEMTRTLARVGDLQEKLDSIDAWTLDSQLEMAMDALRCPPKEATCDTLSGGECRRVALCRLLLSNPDVLLLDEPTNHLDAESVNWLEQHLKRYAGTVIAVTHDRYFLDNVAGWILELDRGIGHAYKGNYTGWLEQKHRRMVLEDKQETVRQKTLSRELDWVRQNPKGRQAKSKARVTAYEKLLGEDQEKRAKDIEIYIPPGPRLGNLVIEAKDVSKAYGDTLLLDGVSFSIPPGAIVGVIGPNGAGKTTLFKMINKLEQPDAGSFKVGETVTISYVEQTRDSLPLGKNVWEVISDGSEEIRLGTVKVNSRAYVARFGFSGTDQQKLVENLSGGERNRVHLARLLRQGSNVILLDEPTNDLDVNVMRGLEEALENFVGTAVIISHDRWFLDRLATHILAFEGDAKLHFHNGNWSSYEEDRHRRLGAEADQPHRMKYRKLTR
ncbi:MAG: energy-dependent translational throttle protein EttA [Planctomycetota bacterium]|jgi:ATP-binding cassette ChvD family protein|nr:MAG: energy-dependent translational throttle protein EttA [Planctomycetota bacterium]RLS92487.1 MAG: energy-dependent translational throttle protein EttA [Planctomycetota bacterium]